MWTTRTAANLVTCSRQNIGCRHIALVDILAGNLGTVLLVNLSMRWRPTDHQVRSGLSQSCGPRQASIVYLRQCFVRTVYSMLGRYCVSEADAATDLCAERPAISFPFLPNSILEPLLHCASFSTFNPHIRSSFDHDSASFTFVTAHKTSSSTLITQ